MANDKNPQQKTHLAAVPAPAKAVAAEPAMKERFFKVTKTCRVPRGASYFTLHAGRVISNKGYDIQALTDMGVPLEETTETTSPPARAQIV